MCTPAWSNCSNTAGFGAISAPNQPCGTAGVTCANQCCSGTTNATALDFTFYTDSCNQIVGYCFLAPVCGSCGGGGTPAPSCGGFTNCADIGNAGYSATGYATLDPTPHGICTGCSGAGFVVWTKSGCSNEYCWDGTCTGCSSGGGGDTPPPDGGGGGGGTPPPPDGGGGGGCSDCFGTNCQPGGCSPEKQFCLNPC